jgi:hypothetical protein
MIGLGTLGALGNLRMVSVMSNARPTTNYERGYARAKSDVKEHIAAMLEEADMYNYTKVMALLELLDIMERNDGQD